MNLSEGDSQSQTSPFKRRLHELFSPIFKDKKRAAEKVETPPLHLDRPRQMAK